MISFEILLGKIEPMGKPSVRVSKNRGYFPIAYQRYVQWIGMAIQRQWKAQKAEGSKMVSSPFCAVIEFGFLKKKVGKPDLDNLLKSIFDVLQTNQIIKDDSLLVAVSAKKVYDDTQNRITICLSNN